MGEEEVEVAGEEVGEAEGVEDGVAAVTTSSHISSNTSSGVETSKAITTTHEYYCMLSVVPSNSTGYCTKQSDFILNPFPLAFLL